MNLVRRAVSVPFTLRLADPDHALMLTHAFHRNLDDNEFHSYLWLLQHRYQFQQTASAILRKAQERAIHGQITDPLQIFFELAYLLPDLKSLLPYIQSGSGKRNLNFEVRDVGVAWIYGESLKGISKK